MLIEIIPPPSSLIFFIWWAIIQLSSYIATSRARRRPSKALTYTFFTYTKNQLFLTPFYDNVIETRLFQVKMMQGNVDGRCGWIGVVYCPNALNAVLIPSTLIPWRSDEHGRRCRRINSAAVWNQNKLCLRFSSTQTNQTLEDKLWKNGTKLG